MINSNSILDPFERNASLLIMKSKATLKQIAKELNVSIPDDQAENIQTVGQAITYLEENAK